MKRKIIWLSLLCCFLVASLVLYFVRGDRTKERYDDLELVCMAGDRIFYDSLSEVENNSTIIVEAVAKEVLGQEVNTHFDYHYQREIPDYGYTKREMKITKVYKGDINVGDKMTMVQDYYVWTSSEGIKQLISFTSLKPVEKNEKYLLFLKYQESFNAYIVVCDYQGLYPISKDEISETTSNIEQVDLSYVHKVEELHYLKPIYNEVKAKYFK